MERLVLVHGSVRNGDFAWVRQRELAARFELVVLNRPGFPPNPPEERVDFEEHGQWVGDRLRPGDHLCGHSYGAIVALFAAALVRRLRSLTVIEPPAFGLAAEDPEVAAVTERQKAYWSNGPSDPRAFLSGFYALVGGRSTFPIHCRLSWSRALGHSSFNADLGRRSHLFRRSPLLRTASSLSREDGVRCSKRCVMSSRSDLQPNAKFLLAQVTMCRMPKGSTRGF